MMIKKFIICTVIGLLSLHLSYSQQDTLKAFSLKEVTVTGKTGLGSKNESKPLSSLDEYIDGQDNISLVKRGAYAWEPTINNMPTERISVTIDGMKIFCACTDKMDPVSSYVEIINLSKVDVNSGISGNPYASTSVGGSLDLKLNKAGFQEKKLDVNVNTGYETNGNYRVVGGGVAYSSPTFYTNASLFYRKSDNYYAGGNEEVNFSQFEKVNAFTNLGYRFLNNNIIEGTLIYDVSSNVGYPALTMDVKSAKGFISSLSYRKERFSHVFSTWETKVYYNTIDHVMDDTKRPNVTIHMDMPGSSRTNGFYSTLQGKTDGHVYLLNLDSYYNRSSADMTMYPKNGLSTFMYTWPDVRTFNSSVFLQDRYAIDKKNRVQLSSKVAFQRDGVQSDFGLNTLQIFYPDMDRFQNRLLWNVGADYYHLFKNVQLKLSGAYGLRAPSASETYGYFLYNSFDGYDYLGNPHLKNESSLQGNFSLNVEKGGYKFTIESSYFYLYNYIIGKVDKSLYTMTIGANGVKKYQNIDHASIFNVNVDLKKSFLRYFIWNNHALYSLGSDDQGNPLPLISPLTYSSALAYNRQRYNVEFKLQGAATQTRYDADYGEDETPAYLIFGASAGYKFRYWKLLSQVRVGVENILDKKYSTYSDWNNIPRKGRNLFINLVINTL
ncbi:MAG: TonB-dependent receptor [Paludibacteraceae bacterium]|nr:TonB-dependent receptor [Paludibacteraceae bacterium]